MPAKHSLRIAHGTLAEELFSGNPNAHLDSPASFKSTQTLTIWTHLQAGSAASTDRTSVILPRGTTPAPCHPIIIQIRPYMSIYIPGETIVKHTMYQPSQQFSIVDEIIFQVRIPVPGSPKNIPGHCKQRLD